MSETSTYKLGIDIGSTTLKICLLDNENHIVHSDYRRHNAAPADTARIALRGIREKAGGTNPCVAITGSVGMGYAERMGVGFVQEVIAASKYVGTFHPGVHTLVDIGGEDSKMIFYEPVRIPEMRMNGNCAGGTGSFIDQTASLLGVATTELDALAAQAETIYPIASRCGVFSKTDIQNLLARNVSKADIAASMLRAVAMQVVSALARGMEVKPQVLLCGGPLAFMPQLRKHLCAVSGLADGDTEYLPTLFGMAGYRFENLPMGSLADAEQGLREANNDICYPATIVVGSIMRALKSGRYNLDEVVVAITQTGGQCRASNYYSLIKNAMVRAGFADVPVVSVNMSAALGNSQPGFSIPWLKMWRTALYSTLFADSMLKLYYPSVVREVQPGKARKLYEHYTAEVQPLLAARDYRAILRLLSNAATDFASITHTDRQVPRVGIVGEIYVKYNSFSNQDAATWLVSRGIEVVPPALTPFFLKYFATAKVEKKCIHRHVPLPTGVLDAADRLLRSVTDKFEAACAAFPLFRPFENIHDVMRLASQVVNPAANFGEGWYLPGEICHLAESGVDKVVSLQPFGCIANHIISKGIEKRIKELYPTLSLLFLDFDSGTSEANVHNRLHFMLSR